MAKSEKKEKKKFSIDSLEDYIDNLSKKLDKKIDHKKLEEDKNKIYWKGTRYYTESFKENVSTYALIIGAILLVLAVIIGTFVIFGTKKENEGNVLNKGEYSIKIHIDFTENLIFSRYDVRLSLGERTTTLSHGESKDVEFYLDKGTYTLSFINMDDTSIRHEEEIEINSNMEIGYKISCHSDKINVEKLYVDKDEEIDSDKIKIDFDKSKFTSKNYKDVVNELKKMGFTNIVEKPLYDIGQKKEKLRVLL